MCFTPCGHGDTRLTKSDIVSRSDPHNPEVDMPNDAGRVAWLRWLISQGYGDKLLVAQDICQRHRLSRYGGHGYHYILAEIAPRMLTRGLGVEDVGKILVTNPAAVLTFAKPRSEESDIACLPGAKL